MVEYWEPGTQYDYGSVVIFDDVKYKIIQPHRSQSDWTPPATPALWGRMQEHHGHHQSSQQWGEDCKPQPPAPTYGEQPQAPLYQQPQQPQPQAEPTHEERKKHWYDLDDHRKKELEVGGGILAGVALLGAGYQAYKSHEKSAEEKKAHLWSLNNWITEAQSRTYQYRNGNYPSPVAWVLTQGKNIPTDAIEGGYERGEPLYICRAYQDGGLMIGKASSVFKKGAVIGYKKEEIHLDQYEILVGNPRAVRWVSVSGTLKVEHLGYVPVEGGSEPSGDKQYIAKAPYHDAVHPGKASEVYGDGAYIPYDNTEKKIKEYAVLCYV
ncbi:carbohydrate-binding module family 12 protein [Serpula lacrymans var. lacrymans S7.3]|uniref:Carbohydrate-binding module family 12 protein n=2 Tax=Serpula lacrymans var. lacrymans TaxID=341189 RepID=F8PU33_SERL3|nr:carbohydrate-binding module family 12 protein [Serpula lacrymans var. lacrymans S7.9]EGN99972.1 carbohydrate-binding module family 12 protein [Serpula lacrymans var. lacrymans S7.3]EGO25537.1 carbohydrate-binding module family 12 protein [Serpula lacrymans var. lacrymans S7.9]